MNGKFSIVDLDLCFVGDSNARPGQIGDLTALTKSIHEFGVLVPLFVVAVEREGGGLGLEVIDGQRRMAAAREAGLSQVPAIVYDEMPKAEELGIALNVLREQLNNTQIARAAGHVLGKLGFVAGDVRTLALAKKSSAKLLAHPGIIDAASACGVTPESFIRYGALSSLDASWWDRHAAGRITLADMARVAGLTDEQRAELEKQPPERWIGSEHIGAVTGVTVYASQVERKHALFANTKDLEEVSDLFGEAHGLTPASAVLFMERQTAVVKEIAEKLEGVGFTVTQDNSGYSARFDDRTIYLDRKGLKAAISTVNGHDDKEVVIDFTIRRTGQVQLTIRTKIKRAASAKERDDESRLSAKQYDEALDWLAQRLLGDALDKFGIVFAWAAATTKIESHELGLPFNGPFHAYAGFGSLRGRPVQADIAEQTAEDLFRSEERSAFAHYAAVAERLVRNMALGVSHSRMLYRATLCLMAALEIDPRNSFSPSVEFLKAVAKDDLIAELKRLNPPGWSKSMPKAELAERLHAALAGKPWFPEVAGWIPPGAWQAAPELFFMEALAGRQKQEAMAKAIEPSEEDGEGADPAAQPDVHAAHRGDTPDGTGDADFDSDWT